MEDKTKTVFVVGIIIILIALLWKVLLFLGFACLIVGLFLLYKKKKEVESEKKTEQPN